MFFFKALCQRSGCFSVYRLTCVLGAYFIVEKDGDLSFHRVRWSLAGATRAIECFSREEGQEEEKNKSFRARLKDADAGLLKESADGGEKT